MKIYSMTATFGKLENQTLTFQPGLNIIEAPNEWGKSTWCAFLVAMLYGIDTRERTTQTTLADKEHYAPWSGAPMEGRMDICWKGRDITIERRTRGRLIFGEFRAYETATGMDVPELTATNCGMELLGVERSVFLRAGFLRLSDMPVTQDDALRRRLNNLVTTGDETGSGDKLAQALKELKNKCRYNKNGLLPAAEAERDKLEEQLRNLQDLNAQAERLQERQKELETWISKLENHKAALRYAQAQEETQHIRVAQAGRDQIAQQLTAMEAECAGLPSSEEAERSRTELQRLHNESMSLQMEQQMLPPAPVAPACDKCFEGMTGEQAIAQAKADAEQAALLKKKTPLTGVGIALAILGALAAAAGFVLTNLQLPLWIAGGAVLLVGVILLILGVAKNGKSKACLASLSAKYETADTATWLAKAEKFAQSRMSYDDACAQYRQTLEDIQARRDDLVARLQAITGGEAIGTCLTKWEQIAQKWQNLADMRRDLQRTESQIATLLAMTKDVPAPTASDELTQTMSETDTLLTNAAFEQKQNQHRIGQFQGQAEMIGQETALRAQLKQVKGRIERLEETYAALELAQKALGAATSELQRRFAPRIAKRAQELFSKLTGGRYQRMMLAEDLSIHVSAEQETTMRTSQWRSDGTVDQVYLALRLAVAEELTPDAPLVLDDAMVRFDDTRLATALNILDEMAENKQVILFTCQSREKKLQGEA